MNKPNLFLIGFQKCGSSSLFDYLIQHPEIQGTSKKETFSLTDESYEHYTLENSVKNPNFDWSKYLDFNSNNKYFLEGSVCNFYQKTAQEYIRSIENAKVILLIRNPLDRFSSAFNYYGRNGVYLKPGTSIEEFYEISERKSSSKEGVNFALDHGKYSIYISQWQALLGQESVLVIGMKDFLKNSEITAERISKFLNVNNDFPASINHKNKSLVVKNKKLHLILRKLASVFGFKNKALIEKYRSLSRKEAEKIALSKEMKAKLEAYYSEEFRLYSELF